MADYLLWLVLAVSTWLALVVKNKTGRLYATIIIVLLGAFVRIMQFFIVNILNYFIGATYLNMIFGMFISAIFVAAFAAVPIVSSKARESGMAKWLNFLFGYFATAFALSYLAIFL